MKKRILHRLLPLFGLAVFAAALWVLRREMEAYTYHDVAAAVRDLPLARVLTALGFSVAGYFALMGYDVLGMRYLRHPLPLRRIAFTSFVAFSFSQNLGFALITGSGIRYRLYSAFGLSAVQIANLIAFSSLTFWLGVLTLGGATLTVATRNAGALGWHAPIPLPIVGVVLLALVGAYVVTGARRQRPVTVRGWQFSLPKPRTALAQVAVGSADWMMAAAVLFALLPSDSRVSYPMFLGIFLLAQVSGVLSHVPGGLGVFESVILLLLPAESASQAMVASLLVYRLLYYVLPFATGVGLFGVYELLQRRANVARLARMTGAWVPTLAPPLLAGATFLAGTFLLLSGAMPAPGSRLAWLNQLLPLGVIEMSHFLASLLGLGLLALAWGLHRHLEGAYQVTVVCLGAAIVGVLLRGGGFEAAIVLAIMLAVLLPARAHFYRKASLLTEPFTAEWVALVGVVLVTTVWLGLFAFKRVEYTEELWWRFALSSNAPRFLRATVGVFAGVAVFALVRLLRPAVPAPTPPTADEWLAVRTTVAQSHRAMTHAALVGDKAFLFHPSRQSFIMYAIRGRSWVALGDPVGRPEDREELLWQYRELVDRHDGRAVFYQVAAANLPMYVELGLDPLRLGEEGRVRLATFSLDGGSRKDLRRAQRLFQQSGCAFRVVPREAVPPLLPVLRPVSDAWLESKNTREKGFSIGRFADGYLSLLPAAVIERGDTILAFANIWASGDRHELSVDLMRHLPHAPKGVMDYLFTELMLWGKANGYEFFNLGMAPLSGFEERDLAPLWDRLSALVYRHGEHFYNFQGLRQYKEKFDPEWEPRFLVSGGGLALPRIVADVASLISGGVKGIVSK